MIPAIAAILPVVGKIIDRIIPDKAAAEAAKREMERMYVAGDLEALKADVDLAKAQITVNQAEASHASIFVAGWRPGLGWVCVAGFAFNYIGQPMLAWLGGFADPVIAAPPELDMGDLMTLLLGMLGLGGYRTYERVSGVARGKLK